MGEIVKKVEYKGVQYEIRLIRRQDGTWFLKDFLNAQPFSPFYYGISEGVDIKRIEALLGVPIKEYLISEAESGIRFWVENKDKLK